MLRYVWYGAAVWYGATSSISSDMVRLSNPAVHNNNNGHGLLLTPVEYPATLAINPSFATIWFGCCTKSTISHVPNEHDVLVTRADFKRMIAHLVVMDGIVIGC